MCDIIFDQSACGIFVRCQVLVVFRRLVAWRFYVGLFASRDLVYSKIKKSRFFKITDEELIEFVEEQEIPNTKMAEHAGTFCRVMSPRHVAATKSCDVHTQGILSRDA